jgi:WD40 repeat protein
VQFAPDGRFLAWGNGFDVVLFDATTRNSRVLKGAISTSVSSVAFSPDGKTLVAVSNTIKFWDRATGQEKPWVAEPANWFVAFSPDNRMVVYHDKSALHLIDLTSADKRPMEAGSGFTATFSPDGAHMVAARNPAANKGELTLLDPVTRKPIWQKSWDQVIRGVAFAPDGRHIVIANEDWTVSIVRLPALR